jgi:hypothetical protein
MAKSTWTPPKQVPREECIRLSQEVDAMPDIPIKRSEDIFTLEIAGMEWDIGLQVYEPADPSKIAKGADGKKVGIFWTHGGSGDWKSMDKQSKIMAGKFGCKVVAFTFPGRYYFGGNNDWPGDTIEPDGSVRTPIWKRGEIIGRDQYDIISDTKMKMRYGTRTLAKAKPGTTFYYRMAAWPMCMEEGMKASCKRHFPEGEYSIYVHGHSTGGPQMAMLCQRVPNIAGSIAIENSTFGFIGEAGHAWSGSLGKVAGFERVSKKPDPRMDPFDELYIRTWRDRARYWGPEKLGQEGPNALMRLPWLMEEIFDDWDKSKMRPQFKCEYLITHNIAKSLEEGARVTAKRLKLNDKDTDALVKRFLSYAQALEGPGVKPVPPILFSITKDSRDHSPEVYAEVIVPMLKGIKPAPKVDVIQYGAGVHTYTKAEEDLPTGVTPAVMKVYMDAIKGGYFLAD